MEKITLKGNVASLGRNLEILSQRKEIEVEALSVFAEETTEAGCTISNEARNEPGNSLPAIS